MKKIIKAYLHYDTSRHPCAKGRLELLRYKTSGAGDFILIKETEVEVDVPDDFDPRPAQIKALQEKEKEARAAFEAMTIEIRRQISELQAIEYTVLA